MLAKPNNALHPTAMPLRSIAAGDLGHRAIFFDPTTQMPRYVIEREIPGAGKLTGDQLQGISQKMLRCTLEARARNSVDRQLRDRRQGLLRIHRSQRGNGP